MPLNSGLRVPRFALEICHQRHATSKAWFGLVNTRRPPPPRVMKLKVDVSPAGKFAVVCTAPPLNSRKGVIAPPRGLECQRKMSGSKAVPSIRCGWNCTNSGATSNPYSNRPDTNDCRVRRLLPCRHRSLRSESVLRKRNWLPLRRLLHQPRCRNPTLDSVPQLIESGPGLRKPLPRQAAMSQSCSAVRACFIRRHGQGCFPGNDA